MSLTICRILLMAILAIMMEQSIATDNAVTVIISEMEKLFRDIQSRGDMSSSAMNANKDPVLLQKT